MPSQLLPGGHFGLFLWFQLEDDLPLLISRPKIPVTFDSKSVIKKALHSFFLPASPPFAETFRMNLKYVLKPNRQELCDLLAEIT